ncbi:MAG TPA: alpha/beta hydrolase [Gammaproteobacteria bacterium]|jgi:pimeloyl-ACP methyl ester carboxylesterase|nr:alpha/beta hydrolase [Gammaproteobacteria bacterium]HIK72633.1 alpha/beta hydrolase [Gammaproteobacteria bacterium]
MKKVFLLISLLSTFYLFSEEKEQITHLNGIDIWWQAQGDPKNPAVLLIMGLNSNSKVWSENFIKKLSDEDFYVIVYDNRDIGKSTWVTEEPFLISFIKTLPTFIIEAFVNAIFNVMFDENGRFNMEAVPAEYNLNDMAMDGLSLLNHLGIDEAHIVGASMGGMIAQVMALNYPEKVLTLTAIMTTPGFDTKGLSGPTQIFKEAMRESFLLNLLEKEEEALFIIERALTGSRFPFNENSFKEKAKMRINQGINISNAQTAAVGASPNRFSRLKEISMPTLIIHGTEDPLIPIDHGMSLVDNIPGAKKLILSGVGHEIPDELLTEIIPTISDHLKFN